MNVDVVICSKKCYFYFRYNFGIEVCKMIKESDLSEPYCYASVYVGIPCRYGLTQVQIDKVKESRLESISKKD